MRAKLLCMLLLLAPVAATAQAYKCKGADGKVSFQDHPCEPGATGKPMSVVDPSPPYDAAKASARTLSTPRDKGQEAQAGPDPFQKQREERKRAAECMNARSGLGVLKAPHPYRVDKNGERKYLEGAERQSAIAEAERRVAERCQ